MELKDSYLGGFIPGDEHIFYQVSNAENIVENPSFWGELINFYIRFDKEYDTHER